ncbi:MAG: glycosyltransferase family 4 protein [Planctomycetota bacterium]|jgi:glycosyltransferase involved in cell wall biosynthesis|nr:glycosyltransferase family 4 protein [Planctomycetota bacterium]
MGDKSEVRRKSVLHLVSGECAWETARHALSLAAAESAAGIEALVLAPKGSWAEANAAALGAECATGGFGAPVNPLAWLELGGAAKKAGAKALHAHDAKALRLMSLAARFAGAAKSATIYSAGKAEAKLFLGKTDLAICASETILEAAGGPDRAKMIPPGVDVAAHKKAAEERESKRREARELYCSAKEKPLFILAVAPFEEASGLGALIEAMTAIVAKLPQTHLLLMGVGAFHAELDRLARVTALEEHVTFLDPDPDLASLLAAIDVYAGTRLNDAAGLVLREAMAAGRAVAAVDSGCGAELLEGGKTGVLLAKGDAESLRTGLLDLLGNRTKREHLGRLAAAHAAKRWDLAKTAPEMAEAHRALIIRGK